MLLDFPITVEDRRRIEGREIGHQVPGQPDLRTFEGHGADRENDQQDQQHGHRQLGHPLDSLLHTPGDAEGEHDPGTTSAGLPRLLQTPCP